MTLLLERKVLMIHGSFLNKSIELPQFFGLALLLATALPFFAGTLRWVGNGDLFIPIEATIALFALIHVPMTVYLLFDPIIRVRMRDRPFPLILGPIVIFLTCFSYYAMAAPARAADNAWLDAYVAMGILAWNLWHFGKQSIGVCSFVRLAESRPSMLPVERTMLVIAATLGAAASVVIAGEDLIRSYANGVDHLHLLSFNKYALPVLKFSYYALSIFSIVYVIQNRKRFSKMDAAIFLMSVNFFLSFYLGKDLPELSLAIVLTTLGHGLQYLVFLVFHAITYKNSIVQKSARPFIYQLKMPFIFIVALLFFCDMYKLNYIIPSNWIEKIISPLITVSPAVMNSFGIAFVSSVLLTHFWLDSYFWRFRDKSARDWMIERYGFLFKS